MKYNYKYTTVQGTEFEVYSDYMKRGTYATNKATGETKCIVSGNYLSNDLTIRKAIACVFGFQSFRK